MESAINERVIIYANDKGISQEQFRVDVGATDKGQVNKWFNLKEGIPARYILKMIEKYKDLDARWLVTGSVTIPKNDIPDMVIHEPQSTYSCKACVAKDITIGILNDYVSDLREALNLHSNNNGKKHIVE